MAYQYSPILVAVEPLFEVKCTFRATKNKNRKSGMYDRLVLQMRITHSEKFAPTCCHSAYKVQCTVSPSTRQKHKSRKSWVRNHVPEKVSQQLCAGHRSVQFSLVLEYGYAILISYCSTLMIE